jgi:hypothetical protein
MFGSQADFSFTTFSPGSAPSMSIGQGNIFDSSNNQQSLLQQPLSPQPSKTGISLFDTQLSPALKHVPSAAPLLTLPASTIFNTATNRNDATGGTKRKLSNGGSYGSASGGALTPTASLSRREKRELNEEILAVRQLQN